ncbi:MAG: glycosyltransferase family 39 protein [Bacteroidales bacterium]|nr:glycosyltransferase family 39 protein [Bacteroidales bacterium]
MKKWINIFIFPVFLLALNAVLKFLFLDARDVAMDEPFTIYFAQATGHDLFEMLKTENNPPLFFILLHFWIKLFGISAFSVRFFPCIFSIATAVVLYFLGGNFFSFRVGVIASLLFTFSNYHMLFAHEARVYSLFALLTVISMYLFCLCLQKEKHGKYLFCLSVINALLLYSHFFGAFVILIQLITILVPGIFRKQLLKHIPGSIAVTILLYSPYIPVLMHRFIATTGTGTWVEPPVLSDLYTMVWRYSNTPVTTVFFLITIVAGLIYQISRNKPVENSKKNYTIFVWIWFLAPYLMMFLISFRIPIFLDRYTVFLSLAFYLLVGISVDKIEKTRGVATGIAIVAIFLMVVKFNPNVDNKRRWKEVIQNIQHDKKTETPLIICPSWLKYGFTYHYSSAYFRDYTLLDEHLKRDHIYPVDSWNELDSTIFKQANKVIYLEEWATLVDKENSILKKLTKGYKTDMTTPIYESFSIHQFSR